MGLSRTVSEINGEFSRKSPIFPPRVFNAGVPLSIWYRYGVTKTMMGYREIKYVLR